MRLDAASESALRAALGDDGLLTDPADCLAYGYDNSRRQGEPIAVALPRDRTAVLAIVNAARTAQLPLVARGRGTNTTGASVPARGALVVSFERMNRIIEINPHDRLAVVEPGVLNGDLQRALAPHGFFWAPDPTSADYSTIAGNLACNAGGPRTVKYGACRENVLGLSAVTGAGVLIRSGGRTTKGAVGYDLTRLLIGSEGTLALIVEATLKLTPRPVAQSTLRACYGSVDAAARAVARIMAQPAIPCALELIDAHAVALVMQQGVAIPAGTQALLLIEADGDAAGLAAELAQISAAARGEGLLTLDQADDAASATHLWAARKALSPALRQLAPKKINEDVVVPVSALPALLARLDALSASAGIPIVNFGHAGNGNIHVNLLFDPALPGLAARAQALLAEVFDAVLALGGTLSGEHGIGLEKRDFMPRALNAETLQLMRAIKRQFDPDGLLNPGKLLPD